MVVGRHVEVAGLGRVVRGLFGNVVGPRLVFKIPVAAEDFTENGVQRLLDTTVIGLVISLLMHGFEALGYTNGGLMCQPLR